MKLIKKLSWFVLALTLCAVFYTTGTGAAHAAPIASAKTAPTSQPSVGEPTWAQKADPYVHLTNHVASIDPSIAQYLDANEAKLVQNAVNHYNNLPLSLRQKGTISGSVTHASNGKVQPNDCCAYQWTLNWYWWGARVWLNSYAAQNFGIALGFIGGGLGAALGAGIGGVPAALIGFIIGAIAGSAASFVNNECGDRGIFVDMNWATQVSLNKVC